MEADIKERYSLRQQVGLYLGPIWLLLALSLPVPDGLSSAGWLTAGIGLFMATWWITEAIPIPATSLLPLVLFPMFGINNISETAAPYANPLIFLFMGGFLIALAMVRWGLHKRIALHIVARTGTGPRALIGGFMAATAFLSMWVSNTATTLMMLPVGISIIAVADQKGTRTHFRTRFAFVLLLGIAYAANIGGMGTLIGTPPNAFIAAFFQEQFGFEITFAQWLLIGVPLVLLGVPLTFLVLTRIVYPLKEHDLIGGAEVIQRELRALGPTKKGEIVVAAVFGITAMLWIIRPLLASVIPGLTDAGIAMTGGLVVFLIPVDYTRGVFVQNWKTARELPWDALILIGGGLSLASAVASSGLAEWIGTSLNFVQTLPLLLVVLIVTGLIVFLTELTSNAATTATFLPVLAALAIGIGQSPILLAVPAALAASCAFMLPVATPPNAIVYGSGQIPITKMTRAGLVLNFLFLVIITTAAYSLALWVFDVQFGTIPDWAG